MDMKEAKAVPLVEALTCEHWQRKLQAWIHNYLKQEGHTFRVVKIRSIVEFLFNWFQIFFPFAI